MPSLKVTTRIVYEQGGKTFVADVDATGQVTVGYLEGEPGDIDAGDLPASFFDAIVDAVRNAERDGDQ